jgi:hypothetical protein
MNDLAKNYATMPVQDIERLALDIKSLTPEARAVLRSEMQRRQLSTQALDWSPQPEQPKKQSGGVFRLFLRNFGIFFICDVLYILVIGGVLSQVNGVDAEKLGAAMTKAFLSLSLLAAILTSKFFVPKTLKSIWIISAFAPPCAFMLFLLFR